MMKNVKKLASENFKYKVILSCFILLTAITIYFFLPESCPEASRRASAIFAFAALFWACEIIPLYATSILVVLLLIFSLTLQDNISGMKKVPYTVFLDPFANAIIFLFLGSFALTQAIRKYHLDSFIADKIFRYTGSSPRRMLLGLIIATAFLSFWISNTATTAIMLGILSPLLSQITAQPFRKALVLSIPFSANIGGMATPIGTPPNAIALGNLNNFSISINFLEWMLIALPLVILFLALTFFVLTQMFSLPNEDIIFQHSHRLKLSFKAKLVVVIFTSMILLWFTVPWHKLAEPIVALMGVGALVISGLLNHKDIRALHWDILILLWGGLTLGHGLQISGLADWLIHLPFFSHGGFAFVICFTTLTAFLSLFMSDTITTAIVVPIALAFPSINPILMSIPLAMVCSGTMIFPVSCPPNTLAFATGQIQSKDMIKSGSVISLFCLVIILLYFQLLIKVGLI